MTTSLIAQLREKLAPISDLHAAAAVLHWDQECYMPPKAAESRGRQLATLSAMAHRLFTDDGLGGLLEDLEGHMAEMSDADAALVSVVRYDYDRAVKLPETFVERMALETSKAYDVWVRARKDADYAAYLPCVETMVELLRQKAEYLGYEQTPYDALLNSFERGLDTATAERVFSELAPCQSELVHAIAERGMSASHDWLDQEWPETGQWSFSLRVLEDMGYDFGAGRQDKAVHPFTTSFGLYDVRVTTRIDPHDLFSGLMASIHEGGHALYEQGLDPENERTPLLCGASLGIHESQSRMWENMVGRSLPFWQRYMPVLRDHFPGQLDGVDAEAVFRAVNRVRPSFIRVEADECTYNLHIVLRFEIERALIEGDLEPAGVPAAWKEKMRALLGIDPPDDAHGCLQDVHWAHGAMGYFPTYAIGNLYAAQLLEVIERDRPNIWAEVEAGEFAGLLAWLREHIHVHGRRKTPEELMRSVTGKGLDWRPFLRYLKDKYTAIYGL